MQRSKVYIRLIATAMLVSLSGIVLIHATPVLAGNVFWTGNAGTSNWEDGANWNIGTMPGPNDDVTINPGSPVTVTVNGGDGMIHSLNDQYGLTMNGSLTISTTTQMTGTMTVNNGGSFTTNGAAHLAGGIILNSGGTVVANGALTLGSNNQFNGGTLNATNGVTFTGNNSWTGGVFQGLTFTNNGTLTIDVPNSRPPACLYNLTLNNSGTIVIKGANPNQLWLGCLQNSQWKTGTLNNLSGGTIDFQSDTEITVDPGNVTGGGFTNVGLIKKTAGTGSSTIIAVACCSDNFSNQGGTISVQTGTLVLSTLNANGNGISVGGTFNVSPGATLDLTGGNTPTYQGTYTGSGGGTILLQNGGIYVGTGATFNFPAPMFQWTGGWIGTLTTQGGPLTNNGTITLAGTNNSESLYGTTLTNHGTILDKNNGANNVGLYLGNAQTTATLNNASDGVFNFQSDSNTHTGGNSAINNSGLCEKTAGTGTSAIFDNFNDQGGIISVQSGSLQFPSGLSSSGTINIGSADTLYVGQPAQGANFAQAGSGMLNIAIGGLNPGTQYGQVLVYGGSATLSGTLNANVVNGFMPNLGDSFQVMNYGSVGGTFTTVNSSGLGSGKIFTPNYHPTNLTLVVAGRFKIYLPLILR